MNKVRDYAAKTMEVAPRYSENGLFCMAILRDSHGYLQAASEKVEELDSRLDEMTESGISVLAIYKGINREGITLVEKAIDDLNARERNLASLLKSTPQ